MSNGLIVDLLARPWFKPLPQGRRRFSATFLFSVSLYGAALVGTLIYGSFRVQQWAHVTEHAGIRIAVVQTNVPQDNKTSPTRETDQTSWQQLEAFSRRAAQNQPKPQLIVWPETMVPAALNLEATDFYLREAAAWKTIKPQDLAAGNQAAGSREMAKRLGVGLNDLPAYMVDWRREQAAYPRRIAALARELGIAHLVGAEANFPGDPGRRYNSVYFFGASGRMAHERYDKMHLVPFGEYLPWVEDWPWLKGLFLKYISPYDFDYTVSRGLAPTVFELVPGSAASQPSAASGRNAAIRLASPICFEDTDPPLCREMIYDRGGAKQADLLVNLTNDGWFAGSAERPQHLQLATLRCVENRVPMARSVNTGISGFIDSTGRIGPLVERGRQIQRIDGVAVYGVELDRRVTLFGRWGQWPIATVACVMAGLLLASLFRRNRMQSVAAG